MKMAEEQPLAVCLPCGRKWGRPNLRDAGFVSSVSPGACEVCGKEALVTEARDFGYLREGWKWGAYVGAPMELP